MCVCVGGGCVLLVGIGFRLETLSNPFSLCLCVCVCVRMCVCVHMCACERERERERETMDVGLPPVEK